MRPSGRETTQMRDLRFIPDYTIHAEGSVLAEFGDTRVLCTASIEERVPGWMRGTGPWLGDGRIRHAAARHAMSARGARLRPESRADVRWRSSG